jgi:hypothetical protein
MERLKARNLGKQWVMLSWDMRTIRNGNKWQGGSRSIATLDQSLAQNPSSESSSSSIMVWPITP